MGGPMGAAGAMGGPTGAMGSPTLGKAVNSP
jgi:hypothetical protein